MVRLESKKILYVFEYFAPHIMGGAEISGGLRAQELSRRNKVVVLTPNYDSFSSSIETGEFTIFRYPSFRSFFYRRRSKVSRPLARRSRSLLSFILLFFAYLSALECRYWMYRMSKKYGPFDCVYSNNFESAVAVSRSRIVGQKWAHLRDVWYGVFYLDSKWLWFLTRKFKRIDHFVAISKFVRDKYHEVLDIPVGRFEVIYNPVSKAQVSTLRKNDARKNIGFGSGLLAVFVGSITREKGVELLVEDIAPKFPDITFLFVGDGYLRESLEGRAPKNVKFVGAVSNEVVKNYFKAADLVLVPTLKDEPLGRVALEARANGTFVIVANTGGLPETVEGYGQSLVEEPRKFDRAIKKWMLLNK